MKLLELLPSPRRLSTAWVVVGTLMLVGMTAFAGVGVAVSNASTTQTVIASADGYVDSTTPATAYGAVTQLRVDGSPTVYSFVRFDLRAITGTIAAAKLELHANSASTSGYQVSLAGDGWTEAGLTFATAPSFAPRPLGSSGGFAAGASTSVDVSSAVRGGVVVDFALAALSGTATSLGSRESANPPKLVLTIGSGATGIASAIAPTFGPSLTPTQRASATPAATRTAPSATSGTGSTANPPTAAATSAPSSDPVMIGAGDICVTSIMGNAAATAKLIAARPSAHVFTLGDNSNETGTADQYTGCYAKTWGPFLSRTRATIGNHDCMTSGCAPYYAYFGGAAGPAGKGYYSYNLANNWHVIVLNTQGTQVGGTGAGSPEETWLRSDLAAHAGMHILAMFHIPVFTSGQLYRTEYTVWWKDLYAAHADLILNGHDHLYERFAPQSPSGAADPNGIREFIVGTGGAAPQPFGTAVAANSQVRHTGTFGVLQLTLHAHSYSWQFLPVAGGGFTDSGTAATHS